MEHQASVPQNKEGKENASGHERCPLRVEKAGKTVEEGTETKNKECGERNKKRLPKEEMPAQSG